MLHLRIAKHVCLLTIFELENEISLFILSRVNCYTTSNCWNSVTLQSQIANSAKRLFRWPNFTRSIDFANQQKKKPTESADRRFERTSSAHKKRKKYQFLLEFSTEFHYQRSTLSCHSQHPFYAENVLFLLLSVLSLSVAGRRSPLAGI